MNHKRLLSLLAICALVLLDLAAAVPALAQDEATAAQPEGIRTLILLLGIMAILIVGASYLTLNMPRTQGSGAEDEDDEDQ
jgi:hypothetical protein